MTETPPPLPPYAVRDSGDAWVFGPDGSRFWGRYGAAGLLVWHPSLGVLLQLRVGWSHFGGTWGLPGGALKEGESADVGALREAHEEAGVPPELLSVLFTSVLELGFWRYTTVVAEALEAFDPVIGDAESDALRWVPVADVAGLELHPGFAAAWPELAARLPESAD
jgi:8-oxo-dGTP pyrophosphatase MutT (NUDIX family)